MKLWTYKNLPANLDTFIPHILNKIILCVQVYNIFLKYPIFCSVYLIIFLYIPFWVQQKNTEKRVKINS